MDTHLRLSGTGPQAESSKVRNQLALSDSSHSGFKDTG